MNSNSSNREGAIDGARTAGETPATASDPRWLSSARVRVAASQVAMRVGSDIHLLEMAVNGYDKLAVSHHDLVEALKGLLEGVYGDGYCLPAGAIKTQRARAALSKATGEANQ